MAKFRRKKFFKKQQQNKPDEIKKPEMQSTETITVAKNTSVYKPTTKSWIKSSAKYIYIVTAAALLSGIFTPFTIDDQGENVVYGMLILFVGIGGGVLIFKGAVAEKTSTILICIGLSLITISLVLIFQITSILR